MNPQPTPSPTKRPASEDDANNPLKRGRTTPSAPSLGPPPSNRSAKSYLTAAFSDKIKRHVKSLYGDRCWVCKAFPAEAAHIINRTDDQFELLKELGIVHFAALGHESNAILLCPLCHVQFDRPNPGLVIVPADLPWFVEWERRDRKHRVDEYRRTGTLPQRISPTAEDYSNHPGVSAAYTQYIRIDYFPVFGPRPPLTGVLGTAPWHGSPTAMIRKALAAAAMPTGLPYHVVAALDELKMLWFVQDLDLDETDDTGVDPALPDAETNADGGNTAGRGPPHERSAPSENRQNSSADNGAGIHSNPGRSHSLPLNPGLGTPNPRWRPAVPSPPTSASEHSEDHLWHAELPGNPHGWKWGPMASAQKVMDYYRVQMGGCS